MFEILIGLLIRIPILIAVFFVGWYAGKMHMYYDDRKAYKKFISGISVEDLEQLRRMAKDLDDK